MAQLVERLLHKHEGPTVGGEAGAGGSPEFTGQARGKQALWKGGWTVLDSEALVLLYTCSSNPSPWEGAQRKETCELMPQPKAGSMWRGRKGLTKQTALTTMRGS